jgi:hypothetical protein
MLLKGLIIIIFLILLWYYSDVLMNNKILLVLSFIFGFILIFDKNLNTATIINTENNYTNNNTEVDNTEIYGGNNDIKLLHPQNLHSLNLETEDCIHINNEAYCSHNKGEFEAYIGGAKNNDIMKEALLDPGHNLKEVAEQLILLEDHLAHPRRRCRDCITKHYLTIEAFLREAITLDKEYKYFDEIQDLLNSIKPAMIILLQKIEKGKPTNKEYLETCQVLRENRKKIMIKYALRN